MNIINHATHFYRDRWDDYLCHISSVQIIDFDTLKSIAINRFNDNFCQSHKQMMYFKN